MTKKIIAQFTYNILGVNFTNTVLYLKLVMHIYVYLGITT